jgi:hypothetical protein
LADKSHPIIVAFVYFFLCNDPPQIKVWHCICLKPDQEELLENLHGELSSGEISKMRSFGRSLQYSLENARIDTEDSNFALWVEEDYCSPPLAMEREAVLSNLSIAVRSTKIFSSSE